MRLRATITAGGAVSQVETKPVDVVRWEKSTKRRITDGLGYGDMAAIIHAAARRQGLTEEPFDAWMESLDDLEPEAVDPSQPQPEASSG